MFDLDSIFFSVGTGGLLGLLIDRLSELSFFYDASYIGGLHITFFVRGLIIFSSLSSIFD